MRLRRMSYLHIEQRSHTHTHTQGESVLRVADCISEDIYKRFQKSRGKSTSKDAKSFSFDMNKELMKLRSF